MNGTIVVKRILRAPAERVFRAWIEPEAMVRWLAPYGFTAAVESIDARVGGGYRMRFTNFGTGTRHAFSGTYVEIVPNELLRYTDRFDDPTLPDEMSVSARLRSVEYGTELTIEHGGIPASISAATCTLGWHESLEQLAKLVEPEIPDGP